MRTIKEIRQELRLLRQEMKQDGIRVMSCFNGGHTAISLRYNQRLFTLKAELLTASREA